MKKIILLAVSLSAVICMSAQSNKEDIDIIQAAYGKEKKEIVAAFIHPDSARAEAFWKLYDEYEAERKALGKRRIALLENYAAEYDKLDDKKVESMMQEMFKLQVQNDKLIAKYYNKMKKSSGYIPAAQFSQLEAYLLSAIRVRLLESIPFIGGLEKGKKPQ